MPDDLDMIQRIGREVREHTTRLDLFEERVKGLERACDEYSDEDLRRRVERVENILSEHQALMRESTLMIARLNETLIELKEAINTMREIELKHNNEIIKLSASVRLVNFIGGAIITAGVTAITVYLFKVPV